MDKQADKQAPSGEKSVEQKIEQFWRDATAKDLAKVMRGEKVEARFRDHRNTSWFVRELSGCNRSNFVCNLGEQWRFCQVYDPPQWWLEKPDPGEGYRLLEKFPPEELQDGDEFFQSDTFEMGWKPSQNEKQALSLWYRRRIESNSPENQEGATETPTSSHLGQIIEVRNYEDAAWQRAELEAMFPGTEFPYVARVEKNTRDFPTNWRFGRLPHLRCSSLENPEGRCSYDAQVDDVIQLPNGKLLKVTQSGFEVL